MSLARIQTPDKNIQLIQDNIDKAITPLQAIPMVGGNVIAGVSLMSGQDNQVAHKLGRTVRYFIIMNLNADSTVWQTGMSESYLTLQCSADCTVTLWVN